MHSTSQHSTSQHRGGQVEITVARFEEESFGAPATKQRRKTERPKRYKVLLHNDDFTSMEFVVEVLTRHFHKPPAEATRVMLEVHHKGIGVAGIYPKDQAETKVAEVTAEAQACGMPLLLTIEAE